MRSSTARNDTVIKRPDGVYIRFKHGDLQELRRRLLADLSKEAFGVLLGKRERVGNLTIIKVLDYRSAARSDYRQRSLASLSLEKDYIYDILLEVTTRLDVDTIIDVHTHPFCDGSVSYSGTDDHDERTFQEFLDSKFDNLYYASIVLSRSQYSARCWATKKGRTQWLPATIQTQTVGEEIPGSGNRGGGLDHDREHLLFMESNSFFNRGVLALGLANMRRIVDGQMITVVGAGGIGSVVA